jgi:hypothetical protein
LHRGLDRLDGELSGELSARESERAEALRLAQADGIPRTAAHHAATLALATYKSEIPDKLTALREASKILTPLSPTTSADAETVGLWGALHKRLWEAGGDRADLDQSIAAYERLRHDYYNGILYAFMLDERAAVTSGDEAVADRVASPPYPLARARDHRGPTRGRSVSA